MAWPQGNQSGLGKASLQCYSNRRNHTALRQSSRSEQSSVSTQGGEVTQPWLRWKQNVEMQHWKQMFSRGRNVTPKRRDSGLDLWVRKGKANGTDCWDPSQTRLFQAYGRSRQWDTRGEIYCHPKGKKKCPPNNTESFQSFKRGNPQRKRITNPKALKNNSAKKILAFKWQFLFFWWLNSNLLRRIARASSPIDFKASAAERLFEAHQLGCWFILTLRQLCNLAHCLSFSASRVGHPTYSLLHLLGCHED